jgi:hypothetical protein
VWIGIHVQSIFHSVIKARKAEWTTICLFKMRWGGFFQHPSLVLCAGGFGTKERVETPESTRFKFKLRQVAMHEKAMETRADFDLID